MIKLAIFDMDGTVFVSQLDWVKIREELDIEKGESILKKIFQNNEVDKTRLNILENYEEENTLRSTPIQGIFYFLEFLKIHHIMAALVTNNNKKNCEFLLKKYNLNFDIVITREMKLWKPSPDPFLYVMDLFHCNKDETISIGDSSYDVTASKKADISNIFIIKSEKSIKLSSDGITFFNDFFELKEILEKCMSKRKTDI